MKGGGGGHTQYNEYFFHDYMVLRNIICLLYFELQGTLSMGIKMLLVFAGSHIFSALDKAINGFR